MATAGSGDVLTGLITGLLAQGYTPVEAATLGVWLHATAGDRAADVLGQECMLARDITRHLPEAFRELRTTPDIHQ
jgi:NAD(P)H-hydrate epimerase